MRWILYLSLCVLVGVVALIILQKRAERSVRQRYIRRKEIGTPFTRTYDLSAATVGRFCMEALRLTRGRTTSTVFDLGALGRDAFWSPILQWYSVEAGLEIGRRVYCLRAELSSGMTRALRPAAEGSYFVEVRPWGAMLTNVQSERMDFDRGGRSHDKRDRSIVPVAFALTLELVPQPHFMHSVYARDRFP